MGDEGGIGAKRKKGSDEDVTRVAEIVMVLEAMGRMRGGKEPTGFEKELVAEARRRLVEICAGLRPTDLFSSDVARLVAGDLGLNKDPVGVSRAPQVRRMSIAEKLSSTKRKMEEVKGFTVQTSQSSSSIQPGGFAIKSDNRAATFHGSNRLFPDKSSQTPVSSSTVFVPVVPLGSVSSYSSTKQPQFNETPLRSSTGSMERDPSTSAVHARVDTRPSGITYISNVQASSPVTRTLEKTSVPLKSNTSSTGRKPDVARKTNNVFTKSENAHAINSTHTMSQGKLEQHTKSPTINILQGNMFTGQQSQHMNTLNAPSISGHLDIARTIQKILHPNVAGLPAWNPPSVDYMIQPLNCQICKASIIDSESLLVCDACEKGVHLRCLKSFTQRAVSNAEWHCPKCLLSSNGKSLPPKYGKVTRNVGASKVPCNTGASRAPSDKRSENMDAKVSDQRMATNLDPSSTDHSNAYSVTDSHSQLELEKKTPISGEAQVKEESMGGLQEVDNVCKKADASHVNENGGSNCVNIGAPLEEKSPSQCQVNDGLVSSNVQGKTSESIDHSNADSVTDSHSQLELDKKTPISGEAQVKEESMSGLQEVDNLCKKADASHINENGGSNCVNIGAPLKGESRSQCQANDGLVSFNVQGKTSESLHLFKDNLTNHLVEQHIVDVKVPPDSQSVVATAENVAENPFSEIVSEDLCEKIDKHKDKDEHQSANFLGTDCPDTTEEKIYHQCCHISGLTYSLQDVVLVASDGLNVFPAKIQVMWENKDGSKWVIVNRFYLPNDLQDVIIRPSTVEADEVYESNESITIEAASIRGPCVALPLMKFKEESEKRKHLREGEAGPPIFLCRWFYDKTKTLFQPVDE